MLSVGGLVLTCRGLYHDGSEVFTPEYSSKCMTIIHCATLVYMFVDLMTKKVRQRRDLLFHHVFTFVLYSVVLITQVGSGLATLSLLFEALSGTVIYILIILYPFAEKKTCNQKT